VVRRTRYRGVPDDTSARTSFGLTVLHRPSERLAHRRVHLQGGGAPRRGRARIGAAGLRAPDPEPGHVARLRLRHVRHDRPQGTAAAARTHREFPPGGGLHRTIERRPAGSEQRPQPGQVGPADVAEIRGRDSRRCPEVRRRVAVQLLHDVQVTDGPRDLESWSGARHGLGVARAVLDQRAEGVILAAGGPAPAGPLDRSGEHTRGPRLDVDVHAAQCGPSGGRRPGTPSTLRP
jgi:hypothetical protein